MMVAMSGCQSSSAASLDYEQHYKTTGTAMKESALSDRWESNSKVAVVSKKKAENEDYPDAKEVLLVNNTKNKVLVSQKVFDQAYPASTNKDHDSTSHTGEFRFK